MKRFISILLLFAVIVSASSFKLKRRAHAEQFKNDGYLMAVIDGKVFDARDENKYTADLVNKSLDNNSLSRFSSNSLTRIATSVNFYGSEIKDDDNNTFSESIGIEYTFNDGATGDAADQKITLNYDNQKYISIPNDTKLKITKIEWSKDRRYFVLSADFDCKMHRWGGPAQASQTVRMKGKMEDITITVPPFIVIKNPGQTAER